MDECIVCHSILGPKRLRLHGVKCVKLDIYQKLKTFLHPNDFKALYDTNILPDPKICNMCFLTIRQIPKGVHEIQELLSEPINIRLHQQDRSGWTLSSDDNTSQCAAEYTPEGTNSLKSQAPSSLKSQVESSNQCEKVVPPLQRTERSTSYPHAGQKGSKNKKDILLSCEEDKCTAVFTSHKEFFDHFLDHYCSQPCTCDHQGCDGNFTSLLLKSRHSKDHNDGRYACPWRNCKKQIASSFFCMKMHLYKHIMADLPNVADNRRYSCSRCHMEFRLERNLSYHKTQHKENPSFVCPVCGKKFRRCHLQRHLLIHNQEKPHVCPHCSKRYATINGLKFHILQDHKTGVWPYQCNQCQKGFVTKTELTRHMTSHTKEMPFTCDICHKKFGTHTGYRGHLRKHSGEKFPCSFPGCSKVYSSLQTLRYHTVTHQGFSSSCSHCGCTVHTPCGHKCKASRQARKEREKMSSTVGMMNEPGCRPSNTNPAAPQIQTCPLLDIQESHGSSDNGKPRDSLLHDQYAVAASASLEADQNPPLSNAWSLIPSTVEEPE